MYFLIQRLENATFSARFNLVDVIVKKKECSKAH